jgi:hypothetical protein
MKTRLVLALLAALLVGAGTTLVSTPHLSLARATQAPPPTPAPRHWEQFCSYRTSAGEGSAQNMLKTTNEDLMRYGKQGWELAVGTGGGSVFVYCFKRPLD